MRLLPDITERWSLDPLVIRTDFDDDEAWQAVKAALVEPPDGSQNECAVFIVDDPAWDGANVDDVLSAVTADKQWRDEVLVVFIADRMAMQADHHAVLAVTTVTLETNAEEWYEQTSEFGLDRMAVERGRRHRWGTRPQWIKMTTSSSQ